MTGPPGSQKRLVEIKLTMLGVASVGKTSLLWRFLTGRFQQNLESNIGAGYFTHTLEFEDAIVKMSLWDTAGQERYASMAPLYYRESDCALVVYDLTSRDSWLRAKDWVKELNRSGAQVRMIVIAGNKADLPNWRVDLAEVNSYCEDNQIFHFETSAKSAQNVSQMFSTIARELLRRMPAPAPPEPVVSLEDPRPRPSCKC